jgi:hypothetical protein
VEPGPAPTFDEALNVAPVARADPLSLLGRAQPIDCLEHSVVVVCGLQTDAHFEACCGEQPFEGRECGIGMARFDPSDRRLCDTRSRRQLALAEPGTYTCAREEPGGYGRTRSESADDSHGSYDSADAITPPPADRPERSGPV